MSEASTLIKLPGRCIFGAVGGIWEQYLAAKDSDLVFDAGDVLQIDAAGLQVVLAMVRDLERQQRPYSWIARSDEFNACAMLGGLGRQLAVPEVR